MTLHFLNDVVNAVESTRKTIITHNRYILKSEPICKLINRITGSRLVMSSLHAPGSASRTHVASLGKPRDVNKRSRSQA